MAKLTLIILNTWETPEAYWLSIRMEEPGYPTFEDNFGWIKTQAQVNIGTEETPIWEFRDKNLPSYEEIGHTVAHQYLRLLGRVPPDWKLKGGLWPQWAHKRLKGKVKLSDKAATRFRELVGIELEVAVDWPYGAIYEPGPLAAVVTISTDYDGWASSGATFGDTAVGISFGRNAYSYRAYTRFPLTSLPSGSTISDVDLTCRAHTAGTAAALYDIHPYNDNGQADPQADDAATKYSRSSPAGTPYINDDISFRVIGLYTLQFPAAANTDIQNAKAAVNRFSLGWHEEGDDDSPWTNVEAIEHTGTDEAKLTITYTVTVDATLNAALCTATALAYASELGVSMSLDAAVAAATAQAYASAFTASSQLLATLAGATAASPIAVLSASSLFPAVLATANALSYSGAFTVSSNLIAALVTAAAASPNAGFTASSLLEAALAAATASSPNGAFTASSTMQAAVATATATALAAGLGVFYPLLLAASYILTLALLASYVPITTKMASYCPQINLEARV